MVTENPLGQKNRSTRNVIILKRKKIQTDKLHSEILASLNLNNNLNILPWIGPTLNNQPSHSSSVRVRSHPAHNILGFFKLCNMKHKTHVQPKSESGIAPHQRHWVFWAHCPTRCRVKGIGSLQQKDAREVKHNSTPVVEGRALSQAGRHNPPRCPQAHDRGPPRNPWKKVGQARTLPSLL